MSKWKFLIATLGGFQFGYTVAVMAGALLFLIPSYNLDATQQGFVASCVLIGGLIGSISAGPLAEYLGRKRAQQAIAALFLVGTLLIVFAGRLEMIMMGRLIQGLGLGAISVVGPMYIAEISPPETRGRHVAFYQLSVTFGILCAYSISLLLAKTGSWRGMFGFSIIPALIHGIGFFFLPDSAAKQVKDTASSWRGLFQPKYRFSLLSSIFINCFQQLTGINAVIYFAPSIFELYGFTSATQAIFSAVLIGLINFLSTIISLYLIDTKGRKPLLLAGLAGMVVSMIGLAMACLGDISATPWFATGSLMMFVGCFAFSMGPIPQLMTSELFPGVIRSKGVALSMLLSWCFNFLIVFTFMDLNTYLSQAGTFFLYAMFSVIAFFVIWKKIPETKGATLQ